MTCGLEFMNWVATFGKGVWVGRTSGGLSTPQWIRNNIPDFQEAMCLKASIKIVKICNKTMMKKILEKIVQVWMVNEGDRFGLGIVKMKERGFRSKILDIRAVL